LLNHLTVPSGNVLSLLSTPGGLDTGC
jgi:hypothetical protein